MSITALMVDLNDLPSYTQEDDIIDIETSTAADMMRLESECDVLDHAIACLSDIHMTLESDGDLSAEANVCLGLALDAVLGKTNVYLYGDREVASRGYELTLEASTDDKKKGIFKRAIEYIVKKWRAFYAWIKKAATSVFNSRNIKKNNDKRLELILNGGPKDPRIYKSPADMSPVSDTIFSPFANSRTKSPSDIATNIKNYAKFYTALIDPIINQLEKEDLAESIDREKPNEKVFTFLPTIERAAGTVSTLSLPGDIKLVWSPIESYSIYTVGLKKGIPASVMGGIKVLAEIKSTPVEGAIKMPPPTDKEYKDIADAARVLSDAIETAESGLRHVLMSAQGSDPDIDASDIEKGTYEFTMTINSLKTYRSAFFLFNQANKLYSDVVLALDKVKKYMDK